MIKERKDYGFLVGYVPTNSSEKIMATPDSPMNICKMILEFKSIPKIKWIYQKGKVLKTQMLSANDIKTEVLNRIEAGGLNNADKIFLYNILKVKLPSHLSESKTCSRVKGHKKPTIGKRVKTYARKKK